MITVCQTVGAAKKSLIISGLLTVLFYFGDRIGDSKANSGLIAPGQQKGDDNLCHIGTRKKAALINGNINV